jgi:hypothetical protein
MSAPSSPTIVTITVNVPINKAPLLAVWRDWTSEIEPRGAEGNSMAIFVYNNFHFVEFSMKKKTAHQSTMRRLTVFS